MSPIRLSMGRAISPLRRGKIAAVRGLRLSSTPISDFPNWSQISLQPMTDIRLFYLQIEAVSIVDYNPGKLISPEITALPIQLPDSDAGYQMLEAFGHGVAQGGRFQPKVEIPKDGPPPMARSYKQIEEEGGYKRIKPPGLGDFLRPQLEPPVLPSEPALSILPEHLRDDQLECVKALLDREILLLADDPGMGKQTAVCVALADLIQRGRARRALIVCPEGARRQWVGNLTHWAPSLLLTVVCGDNMQRQLDWDTQAHIYLTDFLTLTQDIESGFLTKDKLAFDILVLGNLLTVRFQTREIESALKMLSAERRWALTGSLPGEPESWLYLFGLLTPDRVGSATRLTLPDIQKRFLPYVLRRTKVELADKLPRQMRHEIWLDLDEHQAQAYQDVLKEERDRLAKLGGSVARTHLAAAVDRLKQVCNFTPELLDSAKVRALVDLVEEVSASGTKIVVFSQYRENGLDRLRPVLEAYGTLCLQTDTPEDQLNKILEAFRKETMWHVLLMEMGARTDGEPLAEATYIAHFDHGWNPAVRRRAERRLHPSLGPGVPVNVYEYWVAETIDERIYALLAARGLLPRQMPADTQPAEIEERLTIDDWLRDILEVRLSPEPVPQETPPSTPTFQRPTTGLLSSYFSKLSMDELMDAVQLMIQALGYPLVELIGEPGEDQGDILARRQELGEVERVLVRFINTKKKISVSQGRALLSDMEARGDCSGAHMVTTTDFTYPCEKLANESQGRLRLIAGAELYRHIQIMGMF